MKLKTTLRSAGLALLALVATLASAQSIEIRNAASNNGVLDVEFFPRDETGALFKPKAEQIRLKAGAKDISGLKVEVNSRKQAKANYVVYVQGFSKDFMDSETWDRLRNEVRGFAEKLGPDDQFNFVVGKGYSTGFKPRDQFTSTLSEKQVAFSAILPKTSESKIQDSLKHLLEVTSKANSAPVRVIFVHSRSIAETALATTDPTTKDIESKVASFSILSVRNANSQKERLPSALLELTMKELGCRVAAVSKDSIGQRFKVVADNYSDFLVLNAANVPPDEPKLELVVEGLAKPMTQTFANPLKSGFQLLPIIIVASILILIGALVGLVFWIMATLKKNNTTTGTGSKSPEFPTLPPEEKKPDMNTPRKTAFDIDTEPIMAWLYCIQGPMKHSVMVLRSGAKDCIIGRGDGAGMSIQDSSASDLHARLRVKESGQFWIGDMASTNGLFVNGNRVSEMDINDDDLIRIGKSDFVFKCLTGKDVE